MSSRTLCAIGHYAGLLSRDERTWSACGPNDANAPLRSSAPSKSRFAANPCLLVLRPKGLARPIGSGRLPGGEHYNGAAQVLYE
jgi:hypothetical protein